MNKRQELQTWISKNQTDLILITESWTGNEIHDAELKIPGFAFLRSDRKNTTGGGVLVYYRVDLKIEQIDLINQNDTELNYIENIWIKISHTKIVTIIGLYYNSPRSSQEEREVMYNQINEMCRRNHRVVVCGDFNFPAIDWEHLKSDAQGKKFLECVQNNFLVQHVKSATRDDNILDLVLGNQEVSIENVSINCPIGGSDHNTILFTIENPDPPIRWKTTNLNFRKGKYLGFRQYLSQIDWDTRFENLNASEMWHELKTALVTGIEQFIPKSNKRSSLKPMWMSAPIQIALNNKKQMWCQYKTSKSIVDYNLYKQSLNKATNLIRASKRKLEIRIADGIKNDPKAFFKYAKEKLKYRDKIPELEVSAGKTTTNDKDAASLLNNYFVSVFTRESEVNFTVNPIPTPIEISGRPVITTEVIERHLNKLNDEKSAGADDLPPIVLKKISKKIAYPLKMLFEKSLISGEIPEDWKCANVTPIHKKGSKKIPGNYRPISLTSQICRILERIIKEEMTEYLETNNIIHGSQHGFLKRRSCVTNLLTYMESLTCHVDAGTPVDVIYLDFSKAFDTVPHKRLIKKLESIKLNKNIIDWIKNWLSQRKQRVVIRGSSSEWLPVTSGVPQGSVLGPLLFLIYINDVDTEVDSLLLKFADDTKIMRPIRTPDDQLKLQKDLDKLNEWAERWQMRFNASKCKVIHFGHGNPGYPYQMHGQVLEASEHERDLGVIVQRNLDFEKHIGTIVGRSQQILGMIAPSYENKQPKNIVQLYKTLVRPHLEYAVQVWRPYKQGQIDLIESVQRRATRMIEGLNTMPYSRRLEKCKLISLEMRRLRCDLIEVFKMANGTESLRAEHFFQMSSSNRTRGHSKKFFKSRSRLNVRQNFFSQRVINPWNSDRRLL